MTLTSERCHVEAGATDAEDPGAAGHWCDWIEAELLRREHLAVAGGLTDLDRDGEEPRLVALILDDSVQTPREVETLRDTLKKGRSLGVHIVLVLAEGAMESVPPIIFHECNFRITRDQAVAIGAFESGGKEELASVPAKVSGSGLTQWLAAARRSFSEASDAPADDGVADRTALPNVAPETGARGGRPDLASLPGSPRGTM